MFLHFVVHAHCRRLIDGNDHRLAHLPASHKVRHDIPGNLFQAVIARNQVIIARKLTLKALLLRLAQLRLVDELLDIFVEVWIDELQFRNAVLVIERHSNTIGHRTV